MRKAGNRRLKRNVLRGYLAACVGTEVTIVQLARRLGTSRTSLRRHLRELAAEGRVALGRDIVTPLSPAQQVLATLCPEGFARRVIASWEENSRLADAVLAVIAESSLTLAAEPSIFLDVGSSCLAVAEAVVRKQVRANVRTPNLPAAMLLLRRGLSHGRITVIGGEAEDESVGIKGRSWQSGCDIAVVSVWQITPTDIWLRSDDYTSQKRRIMGLSGDADGAANHVIVAAGAGRLVRQGRGGADESLVAIEELRRLVQSHTTRRFTFIIGEPEEPASREVLDLIRDHSEPLQLIIVPRSESPGPK